MRGINPHADIGGQHTTGNGGKSPHHHCIEFRHRHRGNIGPDHQRRLGLPDKDIGRRRECLGARCPQGVFHQHGKHLNKPLDQPEMVENRHQRGKEDDRRQDLEGEKEVTVIRTKNHLRAAVNKIQGDIEELANLAKQPVTRSGLHDQHGEGKLQKHAADQDPTVELPAVGAEHPGNADHHEETQQTY